MLDLVRKGEEDAEDMQIGRYLTFSIGDVMFGIEMQFITEIIGMQTITELPDMPAYMKGIINLRGKIIPVLDVRLLFGKETRQFDDRTCVIVIDIAGIPIGLIVDRVSEVVNISAEDVLEVPKANGQNSRFIKNIGKTENGVVLILDCEKILSEQEIETIGDITKANEAL
ncbi:MAG: purine-binding chemotaxis protein CheW [Clostridiales bacterium]|nr:purine-binding chemotaxis protein CheW [Clostridiales bacterium]